MASRINVLILSIMIVGLMMLIGCNQSKSVATSSVSDVERLIGAWYYDDGIERSMYVFDKDNYTLSFDGNQLEQGEYTLVDGKLTMTTTHLFIGNQWMSREGLEEKGADLALLDVFETLNYSVTINDVSLTFSPYQDVTDASQQEEILSTITYIRISEES